MRFNIITIFPGIFDSYFNESIIKRAQKDNLVEIKIHNLRDWTTDKHKTVDDSLYGGGAGMVMKVEPIWKAVQEIKKQPEQKTRTILFSAKGKRYTQSDAVRLSEYDNLILICGRYEGVDERVAENIADEEISIGDYVLTGGEIPAMVLVDSITRLIPGVLGNPESLKDESHNQESVVEYPQYTRPEVFFAEGESHAYRQAGASGGQNWKVPEVLLNGNHKEIEEWRKKNSRSGNSNSIQNEK
jgi:tRNA (guanine37-N1)-methyltransferase